MLLKRIKPAYLFFLTIPLLYFILCDSVKVHHSKARQDYFYFSVRSTGPAVISLFAAGDSLTSWNVNAAGYKYLDYVGKINDSNGITLRIDDLKANDTISFLSFNLFRDDTVYSVSDHNENHCDIKNAVLFKGDEALKAKAHDASASIDVKLHDITFLEKGNDPVKIFNTIVWVIFLLVFIIIVLSAPHIRYFILSCVLAVMMMLLFYWTVRDYKCSVTVNTGSQVKTFQAFYSDDPLFSADKMFTSNNGGNSFSQSLDLNTDKFVRCDADGCNDLSDVHYRISAGMISKDIDLASVPLSSMVMNDMVLRDGRFYVTGEDPHFMFTSEYFTGRVQWVILLRENIFLVLGLLFFILMLVLQRWLSGIILGRFQMGQLCFLLIPFTYFMFTLASHPEKPEGKNDLLYFSIKSARHATVELKEGNNSLVSWDVDSAGYKYLQYSYDSISDNASFVISVKNLQASDTVSVLSVNAFINGRVITLGKDDASLIQFTNAKRINGDGLLNAVVETSGSPVNITFPLLYAWKGTDPEKKFNIYILLFFIVLFLVIILFSPPSKYFESACILTLLLMLALYWISASIRPQAAIVTSCPVKSADFFYNDDPSFNADKKVSVCEQAVFYKADIDLSKNNYLRCDINENTKFLKDFKVMTKSGYLTNIMDLKNVPSDKLLINDMRIKDGNFIITGKDPYFCLTSGDLVGKLQWNLLFGRNIYLFISIVFFILILSLRKILCSRN